MCLLRHSNEAYLLISCAENDSSLVLHVETSGLRINICRLQVQFNVRTRYEIGERKPLYMLSDVFSNFQLELVRFFFR